MPASTKGWATRTLEQGLLWLYRRQGWQAQTEAPVPRRCIIIAAPHTSNWDFLYYFGLTRTLGLAPYFMAKKELFRWPLRRFLTDIGGIAIDRKRGGDYVNAMIAEFVARDDFILTIAPEGTRGSVRHWRTGFYHIALGAGVPMVCGLMDYARRVGGLGPAIMPTGDYAADMAQVEQYYRSVAPRHPHLAMQGIVQPGER
ncbi:lysophospholipid acyltransferase family protein [Sandarakinorhabdus sp.]|uniref:lysophospholipid acyltransferase family protein n=1 Tax=Sandarakinorhabdus sp. TaxID=1916663 RepID=UPI00286E36DD|nr:lysophospholipid acyltransferase family protein [Sandarakinorhabdus sp.]